jgi:cation diffusion facilitator family transporter
MQSQKESVYKLNALKWSAVAISSVVIVEVVIGLAVNSLAILSDGLHATLDVLSSVMLFFAARAALKPPDEEHTYGHEKFEAIGGLISGLILIGVAFLIFYEAATRIISGAHFTEGLQFFGFIAIGYTLCIDIVRLTIFRKVQHVEGASVKAGLNDALADFSSTIIALVGFGLATIGFGGTDAFASIFLGIMLSYLSIKLVRGCINELSDTASKEMLSKARHIITSCPGVIKNENLKVRKAGSKFFVDATVQVPNLMSLEEAHTLASKIEDCLKDGFGGNVDATIHIEPCENETEMNQVIKKCASVNGVSEVHDISTIYAGGKLYITLHVFVDPKLSVEESHKIADKIEARMHECIKPLENVTVHVEPSGAIKGNELNEEQLRRVVSETVKNVAPGLRVTKILTYAAEGKRYINIDCCFTKHVKITYAHRIASEIEKETKERFANAVVTIHIEPD